YPELAAIVHLWLGEDAAARAIVTRAPIGRMIVEHHLPGAATWGAELAWALGDRELAAEIYPWLRHEDPPLPALHVHGFAIARPMAMSAMLCATTLGDLDAARRHYASGLQLVRAIGAKPFEAHLLHAFAQITPDAAEARELAKRAYRARMLELREALEEAEQWNDAARAERARDEIEALEAELSRAAGLGGRDRRVGKAAERARVNVQRRLTDALKRIADASTALGDHFGSSVKTGTYCSYTPR